MKRSEIESAFNDEASSAENAQWVSEHLSYDTLLTKEELALYVSGNSGDYVDNLANISMIVIRN